MTRFSDMAWRTPQSAYDDGGHQPKRLKLLHGRPLLVSAAFPAVSSAAWQAGYSIPLRSAMFWQGATIGARPRRVGRRRQLIGAAFQGEAGLQTQAAAGQDNNHIGFLRCVVDAL